MRTDYDTRRIEKKVLNISVGPHTKTTNVRRFSINIKLCNDLSLIGFKLGHRTYE